MTRICETCGKEFEISKFQPYIRNCKEHRSKATIQQNTVARAKRKIDAKKCCQEELAKKREGMTICPTCREQFWNVKDGVFRTFHKRSDGRYWVYIDGTRVGKYETVKEIAEAHL